MISWMASGGGQPGLSLVPDYGQTTRNWIPLSPLNCNSLEMPVMIPEPLPPPPQFSFLTALTDALVRWAWLSVIGYTWRGQRSPRDSLVVSLHPQTAAVKWKGHGGIGEEDSRGLSHSILMFY